MLRNTLFGLCATFCLALLIQAAWGDGGWQCPYTRAAWGECPQAPGEWHCRAIWVIHCPDETRVANSNYFLCEDSQGEYTQCHDDLCEIAPCYTIWDCVVVYDPYEESEYCAAVANSDRPGTFISVKTTSPC